MAWIDYKKAYDMVLQSYIIYCLKMYKISYEVNNFIEKTLQTLRAGGRSLAETKTRKGIFQGDVLSPSLLYKLSRSQEKINHLMCRDDIKLLAKNEK